MKKKEKKKGNTMSEVKSEVKGLVLAATLRKFEAQRAEAEANLAIYLERAAGVAEHPDVVAEVANLIRQLAEADECIAILKRTGY